MTLEELLINIDTTFGKELPTAKQLLETGSIFVSKDLIDGILIVYESGFAIYEANGLKTVIRCDYCGGYTYYNSDGCNELSYSYFLKEEWWIRLLIEGEDRLQHNRKVNSEKHNSYFNDEMNASIDTYSFESKIMFDLWLEEASNKLTQRQKEILNLYYQEGYTLEEISRLYGISHQAVSSSISAIKKKLKNIFLEE